MNIKDNKKLKLAVSYSEIEEGARKQIENVLSLHFLKRLAIMPDVHQGYDLPIGGVALLDDHVWPGAVGYDLGCGMCHINTGILLSEIKHLKEIYDRILRMVPVGFNTRSKPTDRFNKFPNGTGYTAVADAIYHKASIQLGTLGGGNHFIEIGVNKNNTIGITIHCGSRRPGWLIGDLYMKITKGPVHIDTDIAKAYFADMNWALDFAIKNRSEMMKSCLQALGVDGKSVSVLMSKMVNENHNHAEVTKDGILHRKGATQANKGQIGIIPANMRDGVWITKGLGNEEFLSSSSHGAGRKMSRGKAKRELKLQDLKEQMDGIVTPDLKELVDESPDAYKNINEVISAQEGVLIEVVDHFRPLISIKG